MKIKRKHKGINQKTGRLNKGYKYSGKKLKSGLSQIIKIKKKSKRGGTYIAKGSYGCVVKPAIKCNSKSKIRNKVSKIGLDPENESNKDEIKISHDLKKIDPSKKYFIYIEEDCLIKKRDIDFDDFKDCGFYDHNFYENAIMDKAAMSLEDFKKENTLDEDAVSRIILKLLKCMEVLLENEYTYYDMKSLNVVIKSSTGLISALSPKSRKKYEVYLIDFGSDFMPRDWNDFEDLVGFNTKYLWPREVYFQMDKFKHNMPANIKKYIKDEKNFFKFSEKVMVYMVGSLFSRYDDIQNTPMSNIIKEMVNRKPDERPSIKGVIKLIVDAKYKNKFMFSA